MIQRLRRKFIWINMGLVCLVLLIVFSAICFSSHQRLEGESYNALHQAMNRSTGMPPPKVVIGDKPLRGGQSGRPLSNTPVFWVELDKDGTIRNVNKDNVTVSDEVIARAVEEAEQADGRRGVISALGLRFMKEDIPGGLKLAFADMANEREAMKSLVLTSLAVGAGGLTAFFFISLFLSGWALRPVRQAWEQQKQFVADASHELKTPLTVILANSDILLSHSAEEIRTQEKWVKNTKTEAVRMKKLVDDMLFLAKSDEGRSIGVQSEFNLSDAVWSGLLPFESVVFEQGVSLDSEIAPELRMWGDEAQIKQLIVILLDNACKYAGEKGRVQVSLKRVQERALLSVNNTGEQIPPDQLGHLFERFYRAEESRVRKQGGYGLGLAIARSIAEHHKGKISVVSTAEGGTTFSVSLPLVK